jgi:ElaB/YqjD/DUF883 family membrane-anchored ribosome-binding protein
MEKQKGMNVREKTHDNVDKIMDKTEEMKADGENKLARLKIKGQEIRNDIDERISENPEKSVLIATGVGIAVGIILTALIMRRKK